MTFADAHSESDVYWPVAHSDQVGAKPLGVVCGDRDIVVFRDKNGVARAMEDRCPHRRAKLSAGWLTPGGDLQCRYHGWCFNAASGECADVPNHRPGEAIPRYKVPVFRTCEAGGFVLIAPTDRKVDAAPLLWADLPSHPTGPCGAALLPLAHATMMELLLDHPQALLRLAPRFSDLILEREPRSVSTSKGGTLTIVERYGHWRLRGGLLVNRRSALLFRTETQQTSGFSRIVLRQEGGETELDMLIAGVPVPPYATHVLWRVLSAGGRMRGVVNGAPWAARQRALVAIELAHADRPAGASGLVTSPSETWRRTSAGAKYPEFGQARTCL